MYDCKKGVKASFIARAARLAVLSAAVAVPGAIQVRKRKGPASAGPSAALLTRVADSDQSAASVACAAGRLPAPLIAGWPGRHKRCMRSEDR